MALTTTSSASDRTGRWIRGHTDRMRRIVLRIQTARTALLTVASFTAGTASVWAAWGAAPGLGAMSAFLLWLAHLSADERNTR